MKIEYYNSILIKAILSADWKLELFESNENQLQIPNRKIERTSKIPE